LYQAGETVGLVRPVQNIEGPLAEIQDVRKDMGWSKMEQPVQKPLTERVRETWNEAGERIQPYAEQAKDTLYHTGEQMGFVNNNNTQNIGVPRAEYTEVPYNAAIDDQQKTMAVNERMQMFAERARQKMEKFSVNVGLNPGFDVIGQVGPANTGYGVGQVGPANPGYGVGQVGPANPGYGVTGPVNTGYGVSCPAGFANPGYGQVGLANPGYGVSGQVGPANPGYGVSGQVGPANPGYGVSGQVGPVNPGYGVGQVGPANNGYAGGAQNWSQGQVWQNEANRGPVFEETRMMKAPENIVVEQTTKVHPA